MVAILESLKDMDVKKPSVEERSPDSGKSIPVEELALKHEQEDYVPTQSKSLSTESVSTSAVKDHKPTSQMLSPSNIPLSSETEESSPCHSSTSNHNVPDTNVNNKVSLVTAQTPVDAPCDMEGKTSCSVSNTDTHSGNQRSSEIDLVDRTTVTVKVEKSPTTNIMDGLLRRWDLNFFKGR